MARLLLILVGLPLLLAGLGWYAAQPTVHVQRELLDRGGALAAVPIDSVRMLSSFMGDGCAPARVLARLFVDGRLFSPSNTAVQRALRRAAARLGGNAVAYTTPSMEDLPVLGVLDRLWSGDEAEGMEYTAKRAGRAVALRCAWGVRSAL